MAMNIPHILVVGSLNTDLITRTPVVPTGGETLTASSFATGSGGKGANQAVACARASRPCPSKNTSPEPPIAKVSMIGAVGDEPYGQQLLEELARNGIDTEGVEVIPDEISGVAVIIVEESTGENRILVTPGANAKLTAKAFEAFLVRGKPDLVVLQLETPLDTVISVIETSKKLGVEVLLNPAPAVPLPESILHGLDHLVMNETEAGILAGWCGESVDEDSLGKVHQKFETLGVRNTVVTLGANGVSYNLDNGQAASVPAEKVSKVVDTTAAGDTFVGAYAVEIARSKASGSSFDKDLAVKKANRAAARTVEKAGAMKSIPWLDELEISTS